MTTRINAAVHVDQAELHHRLLSTGAGVITFGAHDGWPCIDVFFQGTAEIDAVIAELVALKQEMDPPVPVVVAEQCSGCGEITAHADGCEFMPAAPVPWSAVITDSERDCDEVNPDGDWPCHRGGDHGVHRDSNGGEWRSDLAASVTA